MSRKLLIALLGISLVAAVAFAAARRPIVRGKPGSQQMEQGNFKDAYETLSKQALDPADDPKQVSAHLTQAIDCLNQLGRQDEIDDFREKVIAAHGKNWRLLQTAAETYLNGNPSGFIIAGKFYRGGHRGGDGKPTWAGERDRVRSLQLMVQASQNIAAEPDKNAAAEFYFSFAQQLLENRYGMGAWRLQYLTDLGKLPDYEGGYYHYYGDNDRGAPVKEDGTPVYYGVAKTWQDAQNDGERWRWCLLQAAELSPKVAPRARLVFAQFLRGQFDVETMAVAGYGGLLGRAADDDGRKNESGPYAVSTLSEDETIARLASGIKRFKLPEDQNFIHLLQQVADAGAGNTSQEATELLAQVFEDRQQYDRAAEYWKKNIANFGPGNDNYKQKRLDQILGNWARFETMRTVPPGPEPEIPFLFRNGAKVSFEANEVDVKSVLNDVKAYIKSRPRSLDWEKTRIDDIGWRLVEQNQKKYIGQRVAKWEMDLKPREKHFDRRVAVKVPIKTAGAYLITAHMEQGNTTRILLWIADTVIVKKPLDGGSYYFIADAITGQGLAKVNLEFFGYKQEWKENNNYQIDVQNFAEMTDADGQLKLGNKDQNGRYSWLTIATTEQGRFAYLGFTGIWGGRVYDPEYNQRKVYVITDRPVYRPGQKVQFKFWVGQAKYDQEGESPFANKTFTVRINSPRGEKVMEKSFTADGYGGFDGEIELTKEAQLGQYTISIVNMGGGHFRVEEYKKPEFEVKVDAPAEPVMLGEKITATVAAKYYFGAPVTNAKVKYKVLRSVHHANWYPPGVWDWFFGPGYWWFGCDYLWYPGFERWGCARPWRWWWPMRHERPEVVLENEARIGADGKLKIEIDTALAKAVHGDDDHSYQITAEVTDESRRTITGSGTVLVARQPFKVYAWVNRGHYSAGDDIVAEFCARTLDSKPIKGKGELKLLKVTYQAPAGNAKDLTPVETAVQTWALDTNDEGQALQQIKAAEPGQYRLSYTVTDSKGHAIEGGYVFVIRGPGFDGHEFRFNDIEIIADKREYNAGDTVKLMLNTNRAGATVLLFVRPAGGVYLPPKVVRLTGKSAVEELTVVKKDMPNFFVEAITVGDARVHEEMREIVVPPESRVTNIEVLPSAAQYKPGAKATIQVKLTDSTGKPVTGSAVVSVYDKAVEYISGGSNVTAIKEFFWKWRRHHRPATESNLQHSNPLYKQNELTMDNLGVFGGMVADEEQAVLAEGRGVMTKSATFGNANGAVRMRAMQAVPTMAPAAAAPMAMEKQAAGRGAADAMADRAAGGEGGGGGAAPPPDVQPTIRSNFADTALWVASLKTNDAGIADVQLVMPENLTTWKARVWSMGAGTRVGEGAAEVVTTKNLLVRLQAPRFFVQKDEVVLSGNVHNYLKSAKRVKAVLELSGNCLATLDGSSASLIQTIEVPAGGEKRVDWRVRVTSPGEATIRMSAITDEESDAMEMKFPVYVHGMLKTDSFSGALRPGDASGSITVTVPQERIAEQSRLEIRYSPSVAAAMVDALPYLVQNPHGTTDETLHSFLPAVITQRILLNMGLDLKDIKTKRTNLNAQEIGDDAKRAQDWKRLPPDFWWTQQQRNPVFDTDEMTRIVKAGVTKLTNMQLTDGGWGWFFGHGEYSSAHTTALVVHGLQLAKENDIAIVPGVLDRGVNWLKRHQAEQVQMLTNAATKTHPWKDKADNLDALVHMVLVDAGVKNPDMLNFLYRDRVELSAYAKAMLGLSLHKLADAERLGMVLQNLSQFVVKDDANQTAYLRLPEDNCWWCWYGSDVEAMSYYLKLLCRVDPKSAKSDVAPRIAKYLINNRKHATYWNSTRDTAIAIEALAEYVKASGEDKPDMTVRIAIDGKVLKEVKIDASNLFSYDNKAVLTGADVTSGQHKIEISRTGSGPVYYNAYLTNFTLEDPIGHAGLEVTVGRKFYKLVSVDAKIKVSGSRGQALDQKVEKYERQPLANGAVLKSGDLVEVELEIDSKNDYEYLMFDDMKVSGFEPMDLRSGYNGNDLHAYMELHDERVAFFCRTLARGKHSVAYRLRAETPGKFSALPAKASAVYAPELKGNSDEAKLAVED